MSIKKKVSLAVLLLAVILATAFTTYRATMRNIQIETDGSSATLTVWGQSDVYDISR